MGDRPKLRGRLDAGVPAECDIGGCTGRHHARGLCRPHYHQALKATYRDAGATTATERAEARAAVENQTQQESDMSTDENDTPKLTVDDVREMDREQINDRWAEVQEALKTGRRRVDQDEEELWSL